MNGLSQSRTILESPVNRFIIFALLELVFYGKFENR